jgi:hypothetical protein
MALVIVDQHTLTLPDDITANDQLIRQALSPYYPDLAHADIKRQRQADGTETISVMKQAGPKGTSHILTVLENAPRCMNPAMACYLELERQGHWAHPLPAEDVLVQHRRIGVAVTEGEHEANDVERLRQNLLALSAVPAHDIPPGF